MNSTPAQPSRCRALHPTRPSCWGVQDAAGIPCTGMSSICTRVLSLRQFVSHQQRAQGSGEGRGAGVSRQLPPRSCRMSATQCLKHEWLSDLPAKAQKCKLRLKSQLLLQSYMAHRKWKVNTQFWQVCFHGENQHKAGRAIPSSCEVAHWCSQASWLYQLRTLFSPANEVFVLQKDTASISSKFGFNFHGDWCLEVFYIFLSTCSEASDATLY